MNRPARYITYASALIATAGIVACGGNDQADRNALDDATSAAASPDTLPACNDVWVEGQDVPPKYAGCTLPDGTESAAMIIECADGRSWVVHEDRYFGYVGEVITEAPAESAEYGEAYDTCLTGKE